MIDVSELMNDPDFVETITRRRPTVAIGTTGNAAGVASMAYSDDTIVAAVQPLSPNEVALLPEGSRGGGQKISVWSASEIQKSNGSDLESDVLIVDGTSYRVISVEDWHANGYFYAVATEIVQ